LNCPYVFVNSGTQKRWVNPDKLLQRACKASGVTVAFHDLRRFRCTQWLSSGVDIRTVQKLMGHADISTTQRYAGYVSAHADRSIREAQKLEEMKLIREKAGSEAK